MYYVYCKHIASGREDYCGMYEKAEDAIKKIVTCYGIDKTMKQLG